MMHTILKSFVRDLKSALMPSWIGAKKTVAAFLAGTLMYTTLASPLVEAGFWQDRQNAAKSRNSNGAQYAMLPAGAGAVTDALPFLDGKNRSGVDLESLSGTSLPVVHSSLSPEQQKLLPAWLNHISSAHGNISQAYFAPNAADRPLIVHIQDVHEQREAQMNISGLINELVGTGAVSLVGLEGATGAFDLTPYRTFPNKAVIGDVADFLVQEHMIGGGEHAGWTAEKDPTLWGVEEVGIYLKNLNSFKEALPVQQRVQDRIKSWEYRLAQVKPKVFSPELKAFDESQSRYKNGTLGLPEYVDLIEKTVKLDATKFPATVAFRHCLSLEKALNFSDVEKERTRLIESLTKALSEKEIAALVQRTLLYKSGRLSYGGYYDSLQTICEAKGVSLSRFPAMAAYIKYVLASEQIKPEALLSELDTLQENAATVLVRTPEERAIYDLAQDLHSLTNLAAFKMAPHDWATYQQARSRIMDMAARMDRLAPGADNYAGDLPKDLVPFEGFCQAALARDRTLTDNLLAKMKASGQKNAILLTGGFHTEGMTDLLREEKVSYVVFTPTLTEVSSDSNYLDFLKNRPALEKLFTQEKITTKAPIIASAVEPTPQYKEAADGVKGAVKAVITAESDGQVTDAVNAISPAVVTQGEAVGGASVYSTKAGQKTVSVVVSEGQTPPVASKLGQLVASFSGKVKSFSIYVKDNRIVAFLSPTVLMAKMSGLFRNNRGGEGNLSGGATIRNFLGTKQLALSSVIAASLSISLSLFGVSLAAMGSFLGFGLLGVLLHELGGHLLMYSALGGKGGKLFAGWEGIWVQTGDLGFRKNAWVAIAGPAANILIAALAGLFIWAGVDSTALQAFAATNLVLGMTALVPFGKGSDIDNFISFRKKAKDLERYAANPEPIILETGVQNYPWGQIGENAFIPHLLGIEAGDKPYAEVWIGAHPDLPSTALLPSGTKIKLDSLVEGAGERIMSPQAQALYNGQLPFLFKVLAAGKPLSIQVHPNKEQAEAGFARDNMAGIDLKAGNRNYKDPNHKPELIAAVTEFFGLRGFKPLNEIASAFKANAELMAIEGARAFIESPSEENLKTLYGNIMALPQEKVDDILSPLIRRLNGQAAKVPFPNTSPEYWVLRSDAEFSTEGHHDRGVFSVYLLNLIRLSPGQAMYLSAGVPHAYLDGVGMEIMANSNNVLRGGLTPKHVDVPELMNTVVFQGEPPAVRNGEKVSATETVYREAGDVPEFQLSRISISQENAHIQSPYHDVETLIVLEADYPLVLRMDDASQLTLTRGQTVLIPKGIGYGLLASKGTATLYRATVPFRAIAMGGLSYEQKNQIAKTLVEEIKALESKTQSGQKVKRELDAIINQLFDNGDDAEDIFNLMVSMLRDPVFSSSARAFFISYTMRRISNIFKDSPVSMGGMDIQGKRQIANHFLIRLAFAKDHGEIRQIVREFVGRIPPTEGDFLEIIQLIMGQIARPEFQHTDLGKSGIYFLRKLLDPKVSGDDIPDSEKPRLVKATGTIQDLFDVWSRRRTSSVPLADAIAAQTLATIQSGSPEDAARDLLITTSRLDNASAVIAQIANGTPASEQGEYWVPFLETLDQELQNLKKGHFEPWISEFQMQVQSTLGLASAGSPAPSGSYQILAANFDWLDFTHQLNQQIHAAVLAGNPETTIEELHGKLVDELNILQGYVAQVPFELGENEKAFAVRAQSLLIDALLILSLARRGVSEAEKIRLTIDPDRQLKAVNRAESFIDRYTLPGPAVEQENAPGAYNRGIETGTKMKSDLADAKGNLPRNLDASVLYSMRHGLVPVPSGLGEVTSAEGGMISTFHHTQFAMTHGPGRSMGASTGVGHYQGTKLDVKQVTRGEVLQVNVKYDAQGNVVDVLTQRAKVGEYAVALPGYFDYIVSIGNEPVEFDDISMDLKELGFSPAEIAKFQGGQQPTQAPSKAPYVWVNGSLQPGLGMKNLPPARAISSIASHEGASLLDIYNVLNEESLGAVAKSFVANAAALVAPTFRGRQPKPLAFGTSGLRGLVTEITDLEVYINTLGYLNDRAENNEIKPGDTVTIARDFRDSSPRIARAVAQALSDFGVIVEDLGRLSTPALTLWGIQNKRVSIMITGSHIPFDRNGIKFNKASGEVVKSDEPGITRHVAEVRRQQYLLPANESLFNQDGMFKQIPENRLKDAGADRAHDQAYVGKWTSASSNIPTDQRRQFSEGEEAYIARYVSVYGPNALAGQYYAVYLHSGVGTRLFAEVLRRLGANVYEFGPSEKFIAIDTEAISDETLGSISAMVNKIRMPREATMTAVLSTDGDSDRPLVLGYNKVGRKSDLDFIPGDIAGAFVAKHLGAHAVAVPISANDGVDGYLEGVRILKTKIGSPYIVVGMESLAATNKGERVVGWEANGGFLTGVEIPHRQGVLAPLPTRDAVLPMVEILITAKEENSSISALFKPLRSRVGKADLIDNFPVEASATIVREFSLAGSGIGRVVFNSEGKLKAWQVVGPGGNDLALDNSPAKNIRTRLQSFFTKELGFGEIDWIDFTDGIRIHFSNGDIAHIRPSGNAPQLRIYAVADTSERASEIVRLAIAERDGIYRNIEKSMASAPVADVQTRLGPAGSLFRVKAKPFSVARVGVKMILSVAAATATYVFGASLTLMALPMAVATFYVGFWIFSSAHLFSSNLDRFNNQNPQELARIAQQLERFGFASETADGKLTLTVGGQPVTVQIGFPKGGASWLAETAGKKDITIRPGIPGWLLPFVLRTEIYRVSFLQGALLDVRLLPGLRRSSVTTRGPPVVSAEADLPVDMDIVYPVIMSGGDSTRLFPVDKVLTPNLDASGHGRSLMRQMFERLTRDREHGEFLPFSRFIMLTAARIAGTVKEQLPEVSQENLLSDPAKRNTFPAILWAVAHLKVKTNNPKATLTVFGADQVVGDTPEFRRVVTETARVAQNAKSVVAIGIEPSKNPVQWTNYGAIKAPNLAGVGRESRGMDRFVEKPNEGKAKEMIEEGGHYWNAGWFTFTIEALEEAMATNQPDMFATYNEMVDAIARGDTRGAKTAFEKFPSKIKQKGTEAEVDNSMDYAIMEYLGQDTPVKGVVVPGGFPWIDAGNWGDVRQVLPANQDGNVIRGTVHVSETKNSTLFAESGMTIEAIGLEGIAVAVSATGNVIVTEEVKGGKVKPAVEPAKKEVAKSIDDPTRVNVVQKESENVSVDNQGPGVVAVYGVKNLDITVTKDRVVVRNKATGSPTAAVAENKGTLTVSQPVPDVVSLPVAAKVESFAREEKKEVDVHSISLSGLMVSLMDNPVPGAKTVDLGQEWLAMSPRRMIAWLGYATPDERRAGLATLRAEPAKAEAVLGVVLVDAATAHADGRSYKTGQEIADLAMHHEMQDLARLGFWLGLSIDQAQEAIDRTYNTQRTLVDEARGDRKNKQQVEKDKRLESIVRPGFTWWQAIRQRMLAMMVGVRRMVLGRNIDRKEAAIFVLPIVNGPNGVEWQSGVDEKTQKNILAETTHVKAGGVQNTVVALDGSLTQQEISSFITSESLRTNISLPILTVVGNEVEGIHGEDGTVHIPAVIKHLTTVENVSVNQWLLNHNPVIYANEVAALELGDFRHIVQVMLFLMGKIQPLDLDKYDDKVERYLKAQA